MNREIRENKEPRRFKVKVRCINCGEEWLTRAKTTPDTPHRHGERGEDSMGCGSTQVSEPVIIMEKIDGEWTIIEDNREEDNGLW